MAKSLSAGMFPVRWVADLGYGLGYPIFNFYSVLPYYIGGLLTIFGINALVATKAVFVLGIIASGVSMYFLVKPFFGKISALVSAVVYLYFPYHAVNIYVRGDLAELAAYVFTPIVFLSLFMIHAGKSSRHYVALGVIALTAVITSHNLTAFMLFIFMGIFMVYSILTSRNKMRLSMVYALVLILSFLLSAFYSIPATFEAQYTNVMTQVGGGADWHNNFVCLGQLWDSPWGFGGSTKGCVDGLSFRLGKSNILFAFLAIGAVIYYVKKLKEKTPLVIASSSFLFLALFMTLSASSFIWNLPYMDFLQYPWRFLNFASLFMSILVGFLVWFVSDKFSVKFGIVLSSLIVISTLAFNAKLFIPQKILERDASYYTNYSYLKWTASRISDEYMAKGFVRPSSLSQKVNLSNLQVNPLFRPVQTDGLTRFDTTQTTLEIVSDLLSIIGALLIVAVIIGKFDTFYGKKTS